MCQVRLHVVLVFYIFVIDNLIYDQSKYTRHFFTYLFCIGPLTVIYNLYNSTTSRGVHLYPLFIYIYVNR